MKSAGMDIVELTPGQMAEFRQIGLQVWSIMEPKVGKRVIDDLKTASAAR
jgi:hypothetical protein